jgi:hypothetical protein
MTAIFMTSPVGSKVARRRADIATPSAERKEDDAENRRKWRMKGRVY